MAEQQNSLSPRSRSPLHKTEPKVKAARPGRLHAFLDGVRPGSMLPPAQVQSPISTLRSPSRGATTRSVAFSSTGDVTPLRLLRPDRFDDGGLVIELEPTPPVDPATISAAKRESHLKLRRPATPPSESPMLGVTLEKPPPDYQPPPVDAILSPAEQRRHHRIANFVEQERQHQKKALALVARRKQLIALTHPNGVIGVDSPLLGSASPVYAHKTQEVKAKLDHKRNVLATKSRRIGNVNATKSLLNHDQSVPLERPEHHVERQMQTKKRSQAGCPSVLASTYRLWPDADPKAPFNSFIPNNRVIS